MYLQFWLALAVLLLSSCNGKLVRAGGYDEVALGSVSVRVPAQFTQVQHAPPAVDPLDQNYWAITHAFSFREGPDGTAPALLVVSRVADAQSLSNSQLLFESAARHSPDARWRKAERLEWKQDRVSPNLNYSSAVLTSGAMGATVYTMSDRKTLIEAVLIGENAALPAAVAREILSDLRGNYRVVAPLDDYFRQAKAAMQREADGRRKNYVTMLQVLQREELDYTPTPRVVVFNKNLAAQFWWPLFDRSAVPSYFAIAGRLGRVLKSEEAAWRDVVPAEGGLRVVSVSGALGKPWQWTLLAGGSKIGTRTQALLQDSGWLGAAIGGEQQGFATIEFPFDRPIPDLSQWLDSVEKLAKRVEEEGLVATEKR